MEEESNSPNDFIINIPGFVKTGMILPPNKLGTYSCVSLKSFESIIMQIQKIHSLYCPLIWLHSDSYDPNTFTVTTLGIATSYKIYVYADIESDTYIVELININMPENIILSIFKKICLCI
jgi:hypothetical protein